MTDEEARRLWEMPGGLKFFEYLSNLPGPLRVADFAAHTSSLGLPEFRPPVRVSSFIAVPIRHQGLSVGNIHVSKEEPGEVFSREDEDTLVMFASQAALVIANARRHRDEQRARADLETLVDTSPVGVAVFNMSTGASVSFNREARRIVDALRDPDQAPEDLLRLMTIRRADGRQVSLEEFPLAQVLSSAQTVRAEEIVMEVADGRSITVLLNATPIRSEEGEVQSVVVTMQDMTPLEELEAAAGRVPGHGQPRAADAPHVNQRLGDCDARRNGRPGPCRGAPVPAHHRRPGRQHARADRRPVGRGPHRDRHPAHRPRTRRGGRPGGTVPGTPSRAPGAGTTWTSTLRPTCPW